MVTLTQSTSGTGTTFLKVARNHVDVLGSVIISEVKITCVSSHLSKRASTKLGEHLTFKANCFLSSWKEDGGTSDMAVDQAKAWLRPGSNSGPFTMENSAWQTRCFDLDCKERGVEDWALEEDAGASAEGEPRNGTYADAHGAAAGVAAIW